MRDSCWTNDSNFHFLELESSSIGVRLSVGTVRYEAFAHSSQAIFPTDPLLQVKESLEALSNLKCISNPRGTFGGIWLVGEIQRLRHGCGRMIWSCKSSSVAILML